MKRIITLLSISLILLSFSACTSDEPYVPDCHTEEETITEPEANYYIKYLAQGTKLMVLSPKDFKPVLKFLDTAKKLISTSVEEKNPLS